MKTATFLPETASAFLQRRKIATLAEISEAMGNASRRTVFRNLSQLGYLSSYSHRGKFYTLRSVANFSREGLWQQGAVRFSRFGTLLDTAAAWVERSDAGYGAAELTDALHVEAKHALTQLVRQDRVQRHPVDGRYIYFAADGATAKRQRKRREAQAATFRSASVVVSNPNLAMEEAKASLLLFFSMLNEKQRRLYAGLESLKLGHGGDAHVARLFGIDPHTVARGRQELEGGQLDGKRVRAPGGGRHRQEKKRQRSSS